MHELDDPHSRSRECGTYLEGAIVTSFSEHLRVSTKNRFVYFCFLVGAMDLEVGILAVIPQSDAIQ